MKLYYDFLDENYFNCFEECSHFEDFENCNYFKNQNCSTQFVFENFFKENKDIEQKDFMENLLNKNFSDLSKCCFCEHFKGKHYRLEDARR